LLIHTRPCRKNFLTPNKDLAFSEYKAKVLLSRFQKWNLLDDNVKVKAFRSFLKDFKQFFILQGQMRDCKNIKGLMAAMNIRYNPEEWQLFIDSSIHSLKAVLLHNCHCDGKQKVI
jgi:hypothetical protein